MWKFKIFECLIYNNLYGYFTGNDLISSDYSDFNPGDPWIYQLLSIAHDIYQYFDKDFEVTCVFLDLSKSFIEVWHKIFIYKLKQNIYIYIYISNISDNLVSNPKLVSHDTSLFSVIQDKDSWEKYLSNDLNQINNWNFQWKIIFNPNPKKQTQKNFSSCKILQLAHTLLVYDNNIMAHSVSQKHLGMFLDTKLEIQEHLKAYLGKLTR